MRKAIIMVALAFVTTLAVAQTAEDMIAKHLAARKIQLGTVTDEAAGTITKYETTSEIVTKTPEWDGVAEPPLPLTKAISVATAHLRQKYTGFAQFELISVSLRRLYDSGIKNRWYYDLGFDAKARVNDAYAVKSMGVVLLLDGTIVEPKVVKE